MKELTRHIISALSVLAEDTLVIRTWWPCLPAPSSSGGMSTAFAPGTSSPGRKIPLQVQSGYHKSTYILAPNGFSQMPTERGTVVGTHNQGCSYNNPGWFSYLSLGIHLAVIPGSLANVTCQLLPEFLQCIIVHLWNSSLLAARDSPNSGSLWPPVGV